MLTSVCLPHPFIHRRVVWYRCLNKLQALVYDILPSTTAVFSYAIGSRKVSANEHFFVGAQTVVSLLQTTQIKQGVSFIAANKVYTSTNKTTIVWIETKLLLFYPGCCVSCLRACFGARYYHCWCLKSSDTVAYTGLLALGCFYSHINTRTFRRALTATVDSCAQIKSGTPSVA